MAPAAQGPVRPIRPRHDANVIRIDLPPRQGAAAADGARQGHAVKGHALPEAALFQAALARAPPLQAMLCTTSMT